jgi:hypothetical protein
VSAVALVSELGATAEAAVESASELVAVSVVTTLACVVSEEVGSGSGLGSVVEVGSRLSNLDTQALRRGMAVMAATTEIGVRLNHQGLWELTGPLSLPDLPGGRNEHGAAIARLCASGGNSRAGRYGASNRSRVIGRIGCIVAPNRPWGHAKWLGKAQPSQK